MAISNDPRDISNTGYATVYHAQDGDTDGTESSSSNSSFSRNSSFTGQPSSGGGGGIENRLPSTFSQPSNIDPSTTKRTEHTTVNFQPPNSTQQQQRQPQLPFNGETRLDSSFKRTNSASSGSHNRSPDTSPTNRSFRTQSSSVSIPATTPRDTDLPNVSTTQSSNDDPARFHDQTTRQRLKSDPTTTTGQQGIIEYEDIELNKNHLAQRQQQQQQQRHNLEPFNFKPIHNNNNNHSNSASNTPTTTTVATGYEDMSADFKAGSGSDSRRLHFESSLPPELPTKGPKLPVKRSHTAPYPETRQQFEDDDNTGGDDASVPHFIPPKTSSSMKSRDHRSLYENREINLSSKNGMICRFVDFFFNDPIRTVSYTHLTLPTILLV